MVRKSPTLSQVVTPGQLRSSGSGIFRKQSHPPEPSPQLGRSDSYTSVSLAALADSGGGFSIRRVESSAPDLARHDEGEEEWEKEQGRTKTRNDDEVRERVQRTRSETSLGEGGGEGLSSPPSRSSARNAVPVSHRMAKKNDLEGLTKDIDERGLWKGTFSLHRIMSHVCIHRSSSTVGIVCRVQCWENWIDGVNLLCMLPSRQVR